MNRTFLYYLASQATTVWCIAIAAFVAAMWLFAACAAAHARGGKGLGRATMRTVAWIVVSMIAVSLAILVQYLSADLPCRSILTGGKCKPTAQADAVRRQGGCWLPFSGSEG